MSAGLYTSAVPPGSAPPDSSFTTPEIDVPVCADAATGPMTHNRARTIGSNNNNLRISSPFQNEERRTKNRTKNEERQNRNIPRKRPNDVNQAAPPRCEGRRNE